MMKFKMSVCESPLLLLHENSEVEVNFTFLSRVIEVRVFGRPSVKLS
jgi:hypothetical protein